MVFRSAGKQSQPGAAPDADVEMDAEGSIEAEGVKVQKMVSVATVKKGETR